MSNLYLKANKDNYIELTYKDCDGFVIDITGASARMMMRRSMYSDPIIDVTASIIGNTGSIIFDLSPSDTAGILDAYPEEKLIYDVELTLANGKKRVILEGVATLRESVTRDA